MTAIQWLKTCSLCPEGIRYICRNCKDGLCEKCVHEHVDGLRQHSIVLYRYKNSNMVIPSCSKHPSYGLDTFCRQCSVPLCLKCWTFSKIHASHNFGHIKEFIDMRKKEILSESNILQSVIIPKLLNESTSVEKKFTDAEKEFDDVLKKTEEIRYNILDDVNRVFAKLQKRMNKKKENVLSKFQNQIVQIKDAHSKALHVLHNNHLIVHRDDDDSLSKVINYKKNDETHFTVPGHQWEDRDDLDYPIFIHGKALNLVQEVHDGTFESLSVLLHYNSKEEICSREGPGLLNKALVLKTIQTNKRNILRFVQRGCALWICDNKSMIFHVDLYESSSKKPCNGIMCPKRPRDIAIIDKEIFYSCGKEGVFIVEKGESKQLLSIPGWETEGLCATSTNGLLVCVSNLSSQEVKVIRCDPSRIKSEQKITQEIQFNGEQPLFHFGECELFIAENKNGDICVSDTNADEVIVVDKSGKFRFKYQGQVMFSKTLFKPDQIITDSLCNIIVTDYMNNCLHILDQNGLYLKCVDNCGLDFPIPLYIDENGHLLVGMYLSGQIKVIRYLK